MLIDDYLNYQVEFEQKYGKLTIVLMQVGSFFELYGVSNSKEQIGNIKRVSEILNIQMTRRNKAILENNRKNALMAGFPTPSMKRFLTVLLNNIISDALFIIFVLIINLGIGLIKGNI